MEFPPGLVEFSVRKKKPRSAPHASAGEEVHKKHCDAFEIFFAVVAVYDVRTRQCSAVVRTSGSTV